MSAIGTTLRTFAEPGYPETTYEIIGVVRDTKYSNLREEMPPIAYVPIAQHPALRPWPSVIVRTGVSPASVTAEIRRRVGRLNPGIAMQFTELRSQMRERLVRERMMAWLAGAFGLLALTLAAVGLYGVIAYLTAGRKNEIGIRLSLGSSRAHVILLVLRDSVWLLAVGLAIGLPVSVMVLRGASTLLFGLSADDIPTLLGAGGLLGIIAGLAGGLPAWRASRLDPTAALRCE